VILGRPRLLKEQGIDLVQEIESRADQLAAVGRTVIVAARDGQVIGMLVLEDTLRPEAKEVLVRLKKLGVRTVLVTGDNAMTAKRIAADLGIGEVHAEVLYKRPNRKNWPVYKRKGKRRCSWP
jgi:Cu+-exporting ATPase